MNRKLIHELVDLVMDTNEAGDFANVYLPNSFVTTLAVSHNKNGFKAGSDFDHHEFVRDDMDLKQEIEYFRNRLAELKNAPSGGNPSQGQK